jgi:predicted nuclease with TOPRIM domain
MTTRPKSKTYKQRNEELEAECEQLRELLRKETDEYAAFINALGSQKVTLGMYRKQNEELDEYEAGIESLYAIITQPTFSEETRLQALKDFVFETRGKIQIRRLYE